MRSAIKPSMKPAPGLLALCLLLSGCAGPRAPQPFGAATRAALAQQVANPAHAGAGHAAGIDGAAAARTHERYLKSYTAPVKPPSVFTIGVGEGK